MGGGIGCLFLSPENLGNGLGFWCSAMVLTVSIRSLAALNERCIAHSTFLLKNIPPW